MPKPPTLLAGWPFLKLSPFPQLLVLAAVQQGAHLLGIEQPGDA